MSLRILVAGGCHVVGYPIGKDHSFVNVMTDRLDEMGIGAEAETLGFLPVHHVPRLVNTIRSIKPDITVLQLGNFETTVTFRQYVRRKLGLKRARASAADEHLAPNATFQPTQSWKLKCASKLLVDSLLRSDLMDVRAMEAAFSEMFEAVAAEEIGDVIVMAPLPCADPLYMRYRVMLREIMQRLARAHRFVFLRSPLGSGGQQQYFVDATHLNALGQEVVGHSVARVISSVCRAVPKDLALR